MADDSSKATYARGRIYLALILGGAALLAGLVTGSGIGLAVGGVVLLLAGIAWAVMMGNTAARQ